MSFKLWDVGGMFQFSYIWCYLCITTCVLLRSILISCMTSLYNLSTYIHWISIFLIQYDYIYYKIFKIVNIQFVKRIFLPIMFLQKPTTYCHQSWDSLINLWIVFLKTNYKLNFRHNYALMFVKLETPWRSHQN